MMGNVKGCVNKSCVAFKKKTIYKKNDDFCLKCGNILLFVCKKCHTQLPDGTEKYCVRCLADKQDQKDHTLKVAGGVVLGVGTIALAAGKQVVKVISKLK